MRRLANGSTAFEAAPLIKPPALRGVSDLLKVCEEYDLGQGREKQEKFLN